MSRFATILLHVTGIEKSGNKKVIPIDNKIICFAYDCKINWYSDTIWSIVYLEGRIERI